jgi:hypothetical protein
MIGFEGRHQWRQHNLFKLRAKRAALEYLIFYNGLWFRGPRRRSARPHSKFAFSSILVRRTKNEQTHFAIDKPTLPQPKKRRFSRPNLFA